jgi:hypothetical protein
LQNTKNKYDPVVLIGGRDSTPVRGVPYEPIAFFRVYRAKIESNRWNYESRGRIKG